MASIMIVFILNALRDLGWIAFDITRILTVQ
jgi:hypothetical protein